MKIPKILKQVSEQTGVSIENIKSKKRGKIITKARHMAMSRLRNETRLTLSRIGQILNRNHSSVIWALQKKGKI